MVHLRRAADVSKPREGNRGGREGGILLGPVRDRGLVTPREQARHGTQMRTGGAKGTHSRLVAPYGHGPGPALGITAEISADKAVAAPHLPRRQVRVKQKGWHVP